MYSKGLVCFAFITTILATVRAECSFPPDHPSFSLSQDVSMIGEADANMLYVYTDRFGNCSGRVTELNLCYFNSHGPLPLTIAIINDSNTIVHIHDITVTTDGENVPTSCAPDGLQGGATLFCCVTQTLEAAEQFEVQSNFYYGLRTYLADSSLAQTVDFTLGYIVSTEYILAVGDPLLEASDIVPIKSFFYFSITPGTCSSVHFSPAPSQTTTATSTSSSTTNTTPSISSAISTTSMVTDPSTTTTNVSSVPAVSSVVMSLATDTHSAAGNDSTPVVIGVTISTVLLILALVLVLLGVAVKILVEVKKVNPRRTIESSPPQPNIYVNHTTSQNTRNSTSATSNVYDTIPASYNEAYGISHKPWTGRDDSDRYTVNQLEYGAATCTMGTDQPDSKDTSTAQTPPIAIPTTSNATYGLHGAPTVHNDEEEETMQGDQELQDPVADDSDRYVVTQFNCEADPLYTTVP